MKISATILAAGNSSRMGKNKLLLPFEKSILVRKVCESILSANFEPTIVVTGFENEKVENVLKDLKIKFVKNENWQIGMTSTIIKGISNLPNDVAGNLVVLGDMPLINANLILKLKNTFEENLGEKNIYPTFNGEQRNPVLFSKKYFNEILKSEYKNGCKEILKKYFNDSIAVNVNSEEIFMDCDTKEDYLKLTDELNV